MLDGLDSIPWEKLTHAYGPAGDVPGLIRSLQTAPSDDRSDQSPLWSLFGNIWHQGTVYEATAYAVPFLIELAANPNTPGRLGILGLLAAIATGSSYFAVHGNRLNAPDFEEKRARELLWVADAHRAVAAGVNVLLEIAREGGEICLAAAHVLAKLPEHSHEVQPLLRELLHAESRALDRAGLMLLSAQSNDSSPETMSALMAALEAGEEIQRRAAIVAIARLKPELLPAMAREAIMEGFTIDYLDESFRGLPWDTAAEIDLDDLRKCLAEASRNEAAERLIVAIESGAATDAKIQMLLDTLFSRVTRAAVLLFGFESAQNRTNRATFRR